jgi:fructose/tagatose bisphosphate aldolase
MPSPERHAEMLHAASAGGYAFPAVNISSSETLSAALRGFAEAESDGIVPRAVDPTTSVKITVTTFRRSPVDVVGLDASSNA